MKKSLVFFFIFFLFEATSAQAVGISNISPSNSSVPVYEKYEVKFDLDTAATNNFFMYDPAPPPGITPAIGVTAEGVITPPSGVTKTQPAFFMNEVTWTGSQNNLRFSDTGKTYWVLRYSPRETGLHTVKLRATDKNGTQEVTVGTFTATVPTKDGFIRVSKQDPRYFEFSNGKIYWPIGPAWSENLSYQTASNKDLAKTYNPNGRDFDYSQYKNTGLNFGRPWMIDAGAYTTNAFPWITSAEQLGNEGITAPLTYQEQYPGHELSYQIYYPEGFRIWIPIWGDDLMAQRLKPNTTYRILIRLKTANIAGPRNPAYPYGFVAKMHDFLSHETPLAQTEDTLRNSFKLFNHIAGNADWRELTYTVTTPSSLQSDISLYLDNVSSGQVYIDEFSVKEVLPGGNLGGELIRKSKADVHTYIDPKGAGYFDWEVQQGETNGVYFKYVVHDKNDWIQRHLDDQGRWVEPIMTLWQYYYPENTKGRWLLKQWYRYLAARWGYSTAIHSWELNNEGPPNDDPPGSQTAPHWRTAQSFAQYMHQIDAHPHLATTSFWCCWRPALWENNTNFGALDYADLHEYINGSSEYFTRGTYTYNVVGWSRDLSAKLYQDPVNKPIVLGESGINAAATYDPEPQLKTPNQGIYYHDSLWSQLDANTAYQPNYWFSEHLRFIDRETISIPFANFVKSLDLNKGGYTTANAASANTNFIILGQKNPSSGKAHLWIKNKNHTWSTPNPAPQSGTVTLTLNPSATYNLEWWNTSTGTTTPGSQTANSTGTLSLNITDLPSDIAVKISPQSVSPSTSPTPTQPPAVIIGNGDADGNGTVNNTDIQVLLSKWFSPATSPLDQFGDGLINSFDFAVVRNHLPLPTSTPSPTPAPITVTPTPSPTRSPTPSPTPVGPTPTSPPPQIGEWTQHAHDAQRTSYTDQVVATPWRWKWSWNGPNSTGGISTGKTSLPRNVQPVTGGGRVYVAAGSRGVFTLNNTNGSILWNATNVGTVNSTVAYDADTQSVFVVSANGTLYKLNAATGSISGQFASTSGTSTLPLPPAIISDRVFFSMGTSVYAINKTTMTQLWTYAAGAAVHTPPAYSPSRNRVVVVTQDLFAHAINSTTGAQSWRVRLPTPRTPGDPGNDTNFAEVSKGWPVIAEVHGLVLVKLRLDWQALWDYGGSWSTNNATTRSWLASSSGQDDQALMVLDLDDGSSPFIANIGHGSMGDGGYEPMGPQPVVKRFGDGSEVVYTIIRGHDTGDGRNDSHIGEMVLDDNTVAGFLKGYVRWIQYGNYGWPLNSNNDFPPTDEQPNPTMAGDQLFFASWPVGHDLRITDRSPAKGSFNNPILSARLPVIVEVTTPDSGASWNSGHYSPNNFAMTTTAGEWRAVGPGFFIYWNQGKVYDQYWNEWATWTVSNDTIYYLSTDGAVVALENGNP